MRPLPGTLESVSNPFTIMADPLFIVGPPSGGGGIGGGTGESNKPPSNDMGSVSIAEEQTLEFYLTTEVTEPSQPNIPVEKWTAKSLTVTCDKIHGLDVTDGRYFTGFFSNGLFGGATIKWMDKDFNVFTADSWLQVPDKTDPVFYNVIEFKDSPVRTTNANFTAVLIYEREDEVGTVTEYTMSETFYIEVTNSWDAGNIALRNQMN